MYSFIVFVLMVYYAGRAILAWAAYRNGDLLRGQRATYEIKPAALTGDFWSNLTIAPLILIYTSHSVMRLGLWVVFPFALSFAVSLGWNWIEYGGCRAAAPNFVLDHDRRVTSIGWLRILHPPILYGFLLAFYFSQIIRTWHIGEVLWITLLLLCHFTVIWIFPSHCTVITQRALRRA